MPPKPFAVSEEEKRLQYLEDWNRILKRMLEEEVRQSNALKENLLDAVEVLGSLSKAGSVAAWAALARIAERGEEGA